jgi:hypothetical protein
MAGGAIAGMAAVRSSYIVTPPFGARRCIAVGRSIAVACIVAEARSITVAVVTTVVVDTAVADTAVATSA